MSYLTMYSELTGSVPKLPLDYARTLVNRAWRDVRRQNLWSFQLFDGNWVSPSLVQTGIATVTQGVTTVTFDAAASAVLAPLALSGPFPTNLLQRQFRIGNSTIYSIWGISVDPITSLVTLTLDRPYTDVSGSSAYWIYQIYYPAPFQDFLRWLNVRDIVNFNNLTLNKNRSWVDKEDPQRTKFYLPTHCVYYQQNQNPASQTYGCPMFELWGGILYPITYQLYGIRKGTELVNDSDTLPYAVGEDCVMALARFYGYEWAEANKGDMPRNAGSDFKFLSGAAMAEYTRLYKSYRRQDRETVDNWYSVRPGLGAAMFSTDGYYNSIGQSANPGAPW